MGELYNENCKLTINRMENDTIDLVVTSPPYFNARDYSQYDSVKSYMNEMKEIFTLVYGKLKQSRMCILNISPVLVEREKRSKQSYRIPLPFYYVPMMEEIGFEFLEDIIWVKRLVQLQDLLIHIQVKLYQIDISDRKLLIKNTQMN